MSRRSSLSLLGVLLLLFGLSILLVKWNERPASNIPHVAHNQEDQASGSSQGVADVPSLRLGQRGNFSYYILSLTWSPGFCTIKDARRYDQCSQELGFVVHGLWPQHERGYPSFCKGQNSNLSRRDRTLAQDLFPDMGLARHQWRKHGSCTGLSPKEYFADIQEARNKIVIPSAFAPSGNLPTISLQKLKAAFNKSNPSLQANMMVVQCRRGLLQEIRVCMDKNLKNFRRCGNDLRDTCGFGAITLAP